MQETTYCGHCGGEATGAATTHGERPTSEAHLPCLQQLVMEPPRYCTVCRRRMKVQVTPFGWTAECSRHGVAGARAPARGHRNRAGNTAVR